MPPPVTSGLVAHFDASALTGYADGDPVTSWADLLGAITLTPQAGTPPTYETNQVAISGRPGVVFAGASRLGGTGATGLFPNPATFIFAVKNPINDGNIKFMVTSNGYLMESKWSNADRWVFGLNQFSFIEFTDAALTGQDCIWTHAIPAGGTGAVLRANQTQRVTGNHGVASTGTLFMGAFDGSNSGFTMYELLAYNRLLSAAEIDEVEAYLHSAWFEEPPPALAQIVSVAANCYFGGYVIKVSVPADHDPVTVYRSDVVTSAYDKVRGLTDISESTEREVVDYEAPLDHGLIYSMVNDVTGETIDIEAALPPFRDQCGADATYIRWLLDPTNLTSTFCIGGPLQERTYDPRVGVFTVIGRSDPVIVIDEQSSAQGTLRLIGRTQEEVAGLQRIFTKKAQPTLLSLPTDYMIGREGQLYFQPLEVREGWLNPDGRIPWHYFSIDYVEISPPAYTQPLDRPGVPFGLPEDAEYGGVVYPEGGWIIYNTDPPDGIPHGNADDRWTSFNALRVSGKSFGEALFDEP